MSSFILLVAGVTGRSHFVHPSSAVGGVSAEDKSGLAVDADLVVESLPSHVFVDGGTSPPLAELQTLKSQNNPSHFHSINPICHN